MALACEVRAEGETRIIGRLNTGEPTEPAPEKPLPKFEVQESHTHRIGGRNVTIQKVFPPEPAEVGQAVAQPVSKPVSAADLHSRKAPSEGLVFLTALPAKGGGYDLEIGLNGEWLKAWTDMEVFYLNGFNDFIANGRRYNMIALPVAGDGLEKEKNEPRLAGRGRREPAPRYFLTEFEGDERVCRTLLKDLHDLYRAEHRTLWWAYRERLKNRANLEAELKANPPKKKDVTVRYWELSAEDIDKIKNKKTR